MVRNFVSFRLWIAAVFVSLMMIAASVTGPIPTVAAVIFAASLAGAVINPNIFAKEITAGG